MEKIRGIILLSFTLFFISCGGGGGSSSSNSQTEITSSFSATTKSLDLVNHITHDDYSRSVELGHQSELLFQGDDNGIKIYDKLTYNYISTIYNGDVLQMQISKNGELLYVVNHVEFLIYNIQDKTNIILIDSIDARGASKFEISSDEKLAIVDDLDGLKILNISNKNDITLYKEFKHFENPISSFALIKSKNLLYTLEPSSAYSFDYSIKLYDISIPSNPKALVTSQSTPMIFTHMKISNDDSKIIFLNHKFIQIYSLDNHLDPKLIGEVDFNYESVDNNINFSDDDNHLAFILNNKLAVLDLSDLKNLKLILSNNEEWDIGDLKIIDNKIYSPDGKYGLKVFSLK